MDPIDWRGLADTLETITWTDYGHRESGGTNIACNALVEIVGDTALRDAVDFYVSGRPGFEVARSVLWLLRPPVAMERCREIYRTSDDDQQAADAINLLQVVADRRVLEWIPEFLASENVSVRLWGLGIVDQLLIMQEEIEFAEALPLLETGLRDPVEAVRSQAQQILDMATEQQVLDKAAEQRDPPL